MSKYELITKVKKSQGLIGLSFLFIETKELCEARAKLEMSSDFQIYPFGGKSDGPSPPPHLELPEDRVNSSLFNVTNESPFETVN